MTPIEKLDMFWKYFRVYQNKSYNTISTSDCIQNLLSNNRDLDYIMFKLNVTKYKPNITFGKLLTKIGIKL